MIRIDPRLALSRIDDELVLLDESTGKYFGLNPVASRAFELLSEDGDLDRAIKALLSEFDVQPERLKSDMAAFLEKLKERGLASDDAP
jgi:hypothetical protein